MGYYSGKLMGVQAVSGDADAQAFITATGISNSTQVGAINTLVTSLKSYGLWTKMLAIYPFIGGTAKTHKFNLKDPRDLDVAFRLAFINTWTHNANGGLANPTDGYANTFITPSVSLLQNSTHISIYHKNEISGAKAIIGTAQNLVGLHELDIIPRYNESGNAMYLRVNASSTSIGTNTSTRCNYIATRLSSSQVEAYRNNTKYTQSVNSSGLSAYPIYLSAHNMVSSPRSFGGSLIGFSTIGYGLTETEALNLYATIQAYQTTLGRQV